MISEVKFVSKTMSCLAGLEPREIFLASDLHIHDRESAVRIRLDILASDMRCLIVLGDLLDNGSEREVDFFHEEVLDKLHNSDIHIILVPGNHDYYSKGLPFTQNIIGTKPAIEMLNDSHFHLVRNYCLPLCQLNNIFICGMNMYNANPNLSLGGQYYPISSYARKEDSRLRYELFLTHAPLCSYELYRDVAMAYMLEAHSSLTFPDIEDKRIRRINISGHLHIEKMLRSDLFTIKNHTFYSLFNILSRFSINVAE